MRTFCNGLKWAIVIGLPERRTFQLPNSFELPASVTAIIDPVRFLHTRLIHPDIRKDVPPRGLSSFTVAVKRTALPS